MFNIWPRLGQFHMSARYTFKHRVCHKLVDVWLRFRCSNYHLPGSHETVLRYDDYVISCLSLKKRYRWACCTYLWHVRISWLLQDRHIQHRIHLGAHHLWLSVLCHQPASDVSALPPLLLPMARLLHAHEHKGQGYFGQLCHSPIGIRSKYCSRNFECYMYSQKL